MSTSQPQRPLNSIFLRLLWLYLFVPLLVSSLVMIAIAAFYGGRVFRSQQTNLNKSVAYSTASYLYNAANVLDILVVRAEDSSLKDFNLSAEVIYKGYEYFENFYLLDQDGVVLSSITPNDRSVGLDLSHRDFFQQAKQVHGVYISPPFISDNSGQPAVYLSKVARDGKVVAGELSLVELQRVITQGAGWSEPSTVFITDQTGVLLAHPNSDLVRQQADLGSLKIIQRARQGDSGLAYWDRGKFYMGVVTTVETSRWLVISQAPVSEVFRPYYGPAFFYVLFSTATLSLFTRLFGRQFQQSVIAPLSRLSNASTEITRGNYAVNPEIKRIPAPFLEIRSLIASFTEMAQSIRAREKLLEHLATHDSLTGLPNRALFQKRILDYIEEIQSTQHSGQEFAVLFIDVDDFKSVNDAFGHYIGDLTLKEIGALMTPLIGPDDLVGRVGGDEFAMMLAGAVGVQNAHPTAEALLYQFNQPLHIEGHEIFLSASIGVSIYPRNGTDPDMLIQNADTAMYQTKREGKRGIKFYTEDMETQAQERYILSSYLHRAMEQNEFELYYQPIVDTQTHTIVGSESLLRWNNARLGMIMPSRFISLASDTGLILPIGEWVLRTACVMNRAWSAQYLPDLTISVNVTEREIKYKNFRETVEKVLEISGLPPHLLLLELSENIFFQNLKAIERIIVDLKHLGVKLSLDDFGTGYSTLSCLTRIPFDEIKIDRSLSAHVTTSSRDAAIVSGIIRMGHDLGMQVVAEGIETKAQIDFYNDLGCDRMQGFFYSQPVRAGQYEVLIKQSVQDLSNRERIPPGREKPASGS